MIWLHLERQITFDRQLTTDEGPITTRRWAPCTVPGGWSPQDVSEHIDRHQQTPDGWTVLGFAEERPSLDQEEISA
jgi:hypothetical protein